MDAVFEDGEWPSRRPPPLGKDGDGKGDKGGAGRARERWEAGMRASLVLVRARRMRRYWRRSLLATVGFPKAPWNCTHQPGQ